MVAALHLAILRVRDTEVCDLDHTTRVVTEFLARIQSRIQLLSVLRVTLLCITAESTEGGQLGGR